MLFKKIKVVSFIFICVFLGCKKKTIDPVSEISVPSNGYLVLNEGLFNQNNASLTWYDLQSRVLVSDIFTSKNQRGLGDTGNDMIRYGNKIYIAVNVSSTIEILDANTMVSIKQIPMVTNGKPKQPRNIIAFGSNVYVSCFDGYVDVIDTTNYQITKRIKVGDNPENILIVNNQLFVSNSGGLNPPKMDSTLSVIDLKTGNEIKKITVGVNPGTLIKGLDNTLFVVTRGNYNDIKPSLKLLNLNTEKNETLLNENVLSIENYQDTLLLMNVDNQSLSVFSMKRKEIKNSNFISLSSFGTPYNVQYFPLKKEICITDANGYVNQGYVSIFDENGSFKFKFKSGLNPSKIVCYE